MFDFPNPPLTIGQQVTTPAGVTFLWDGVKWKSGGGSGGSYVLPIATTTILGGVMPDGTSVSVDGTGILSALIPLGVNSFNTRTGAVTLTTADVTAVADTTYVNVTGDTMSGLLTLSGGLTVTGGNASITNRLSVAGGISAGSTAVASVTDLSKHLALYGSAYGLSVTSGTLNIVANGTIALAAMNGVSSGNWNNTGLVMPPSMMVTLSADPITAMHAATKRYVDAIGGLGDAPNDGRAYGRRNLAWNTVPFYDVRGNVGIGIAAPTGQAVTNVGEGGWMFLWGISVNNYADNSIYYNGTGWSHRTAKAASLFQAFDGSFHWLNAPTGAADTVANMVERMLLNPAGNLTLTGTLTVNDGLLYLNRAGWPQITFTNSSAAVNARRMNFFLDLTDMTMQWLSDDATLGAAFFTAKRNGYYTSTVTLASPNIYLNGYTTNNGEFVGTGNIFANAGIFPAAAVCANGFALFESSGSRYLRFTTDNWLLKWRNDGFLMYGSPSQEYLWYCSPSGDTWALGGMQCSLGIIYRSFSSNWIGFGWDGTNACTNCYIDGTFNHTLASRSWVTANYKNVSAYTPNQNVDSGQSPYFWRMVCDNSMNYSGVFYVANNYNYYMQRTSSGNWIFVEGGTVNLTINANGYLYPRGGIICNPVYSYGNVHWGDDYGHCLGMAGLGQVVQFAPGYYFEYTNSTGAIQYVLASVARWTQRSDGPMYNAQSWTGGIGPHVDVSDERGKIDIQPDSTGLDAILRLQPIRFRRPQNPKVKLLHVDALREELGFSANAVRDVIPQAVLRAGIVLPDGSGGYDSDEPSLGLMTTPIVAALVNAVKELVAQNEALSARVATLERTMH